MASFDFDKAIRWARFGRRGQLKRRPDFDLPFIEEAVPGAAILVDTYVYIDQFHDRLPSVIDELLASRTVYHSTICLQELMYSVGRLDPADHRSVAAVESIGEAVKMMEPRRLVEPDAEVAGRGALLGGVLSRIQNHDRASKLRSVNDGILFLQTAKLGLTLLTRNVSDFDYLLQMAPTGRVLFYRRTDES